MENILLIYYGVLFIGVVIGLTILERNLKSDGKRTRKDIQEVKTRLTQVRKDLNKIENKR